MVDVNLETTYMLLAEQEPIALVQTYEDNLHQVEARFVELRDGLSEQIFPFVITPLLEYTHGDNQNYRKLADEELFQMTKDELDFMRTGCNEDIDEAFKKKTASIFIMSGMDHEPNPDQKFEELLKYLKQKYNSMLKMSEDELGEYLRFSLEEESDIDKQVYLPIVKSTVGHLLRGLARMNIDSPVSTHDLKNMLVEVSMDGNSEVSMHGLSHEETKFLAELVVDNLVALDCLKRGEEMLWHRKSSPAGPGEIPKEIRSEKIRRFVLRTVVDDASYTG